MSSLLYFFLKRANANGKHYSIITDHLGTPIEAYNQEGELIWEREQDLYGNSRQGFAKENFRCPFKYQGQYYDSEVELCYNRFRYYHPETGRYISEDPIGFLSGEPNFFAYVSDTNAWVDLLGLTRAKRVKDLPKNLQRRPKWRKETKINLGENIKRLLKIKIRQEEKLQMIITIYQIQGLKIRGKVLLMEENIEGMNIKKCSYDNR